MLSQIKHFLFGSARKGHKEKLSVLIDALRYGRQWPKTIEPPVLLGGTRNVRYDAATMIAEDYGPNAGRAVPALIDALNDPDVYTRRAVIKAINRIGPRAAAAIPKLIETLKTDHLLLRMDAADSLRFLNVDVETPSLIEILKAMDPYDRAKTAECLGSVSNQVNVDVPPLIDALAGDDSQKQISLIEYFGEDAFPMLIDALSCRDRNIRKNIVFHLSRFGADSVPYLVRSLKDRRVAADAIRSLGVVGAESRQAVSALVEALNDPDLSFFAVMEIRKLGPRASGASELLRSLTSPGNDTLTRAEAARALFAVGGSPKIAARVLCELMNTDNEDAKIRSINGLFELATVAPHVLPVLIGALNNPIGYINRVAAQAIGKIGEAAHLAVPQLKESLSDLDRRVRLEVAIAIWKVDRGQIPLAVQTLVDLLAHDDQHQECFWDDGVMKIMQRPNCAEEQARAAEALGEIGPDAINSIPALRRASSDDSEVLREAARAALSQIDPDANDESAGGTQGN